MSLLGATRHRARTPRRWDITYLASPVHDRVETSVWFGAQKRVFLEGEVALGWLLTAPTSSFAHGSDDAFGTILIAREPALERLPDVFWEIADEMNRLRSLAHPPPAHRLVHGMVTLGLEGEDVHRFRAAVPLDLSMGFACDIARVLLRRRDYSFGPIRQGPLPVLVAEGLEPALVLPRELWGQDLYEVSLEFE